MKNKINKKQILKFILVLVITGVLFFLLTLPFRNYFRVFETTEIRPTGVMNPVLGIFFGWPAAIGCTIGNFFLDLSSGTDLPHCLLYTIPQLAYGIVPYYLWKLFTRSDTNIYKMDTMSKILKYGGTMILGALTFGLSILPVIVAEFPDPLSFAFFCFLNDALMCLFLGFPLIIILNRIFNRSKIAKSEVLLLVSAAFETIAIIIIAVCYRVFGGYTNLLEVGVLDQIYIISFACGVVLLLITLILIAFELNKELNDKKEQLNIASSIQQSMLP